MTGDALSCERCGAHPVSAAEFLWCDACFALVRQQAAAERERDRRGTHGTQGGSAMSDLFPATLAEMLGEAERELALRRRVYPYWVTDGRMKQHHAERQIRLMEAICAELARREAAE